MNTESKTSNRFADAPRDRPHREGCEHANLERPGAQAHPLAGAPASASNTGGWRLS